MIQLERYGIILRQIDEEDIEQVRRWRNDPEISQYMAYREEITPAMQREWFLKVQRNGDLYFMIQAEGVDVGVNNLKDIDMEERTAEGGIFIAEKRFQNALTSFRANLCMLDFCFEVLQLRSLKAQILDSNRRAIRFNTAFGFLPQEQAKGELRLYTLDKERYLRDNRPGILPILFPVTPIHNDQS